MRPTRRIAVTVAFCLTALAASSQVSNATSTPFTIRWTASGDDSLNGRATTYDLRHSDSPITAENFDLATPVTGLPPPAMSGTTEIFEVSGLSDEVAIHFAIKSGDERGNWSVVSNIMSRPALTTGVPLAARWFSPPSPNPARESVRWDYSLQEPSRIQVEVFDSTGRLVHTIAHGERGAGAGNLAWDLRDSRGQRVGPGVYFVRSSLGATQSTKRLIVVK